jgi:hypothetical protein
MIYLGGTDNGRWVPELLNESNDGDRHIMWTQNALADATYLDYMNLQYGSSMNTLSPDDSTTAFSDYLADAEKRLRHDEQHPEEPKQIRPGEDVQFKDGRVSVSGQVAVMDINERLLKRLMSKNPEMSFAIQESFPLRGTYGDALPLGPLMELRAGGEKDFTPDAAAQSLNYWRDTTQRLLSDTEATSSPETLKTYSHDSVAAANLLADRQFPAEAEEGYRLGVQLWPGNPEATAGRAAVLSRTGRETEARQIIENFSTRFPDQVDALKRVGETMVLIGPTPLRP